MSSQNDHQLDTTHHVPNGQSPFPDELDADTNYSLARIESLFSQVRLPAELEIKPDSWLDEPLSLPGFRCIHLLGRGGFGCVHLAYDERLDREVAVKVIHDKPWLHDARAESTWREARMVARLQHPGIVPLHEMLMHEGRGHLISAYMSGGTLEAKLANGPIPASEAAEIGLQLAEALAYAHSHNIVHCDLKPSNILFDPLGHPRITDFGLAVNDEQLSPDASPTAGTLEYMAPEQLPGGSPYVDGRTDVWSLGVVIYRMITGRTPFRGATRGELQSAIQERPVKPPRQIDPNIPVDLQSICLRCLQKRPEDRWATATDVAQQLRHFLEKRSDSPRARWYGPLALMISTLLLAVVWFSTNWWRTSHATSHLADRNQSATNGESNLSSNAPSHRSLTIETAQWSQFRFHPDGRGFVLGTVGYNGQPFYLQDELRLEMKLSQSAYTYVLEVNSRGELLLADPSSEDQAPSRRTQVEFPEDAQSFYGFDAGPGLYALCVVASPEPLPPFSQWKQAFPSFDWPTVNAVQTGVWHYSNHGFAAGHFIRQRGSVHRRAEPPAGLSALCRALTVQAKDATLHVIAIPVESSVPYKNE